MTHNNPRKPPLDPDVLRQIALSCDVYNFGSAAIRELHARIRPSYLFNQDYWYVVFHPGLGLCPTFYTLNHAKEGQGVPLIYDLPLDWKPAHWRQTIG